MSDVKPMRIGALIERLQALQTEHGDVLAFTEGCDCNGYAAAATFVPTWTDFDVVGSNEPFPAVLIVREPS